MSEPIFEQCGYPDFGIYHPFTKSPLGSGIPAANNDGTHLGNLNRKKRIDCDSRVP